MENRSRSSPSLTVATTTSAATTPEINKSAYSRGTVAIPTGETMVTLTFHAAPKLSADGGTYLPLQDSAGSPVTMTVAGGKTYQLPASACAANFLRIVSNAAGTIIVQFGA